MATAATLVCEGQHLPQVVDDDLPEVPGISLRIFDAIEPGFNVVAVTGDHAGSHLLRQGEVAVYDEAWRDRICRIDFELTPGLYCYEHQRAPGAMHPDAVGRRFLDRMPVMFEVTRTVVMVFRHPRNPKHWAYRELKSRLHHGVRLPARTEGPMYDWGILEMLRGPIVGIYRPNLEGGLN